MGRARRGSDGPGTLKRRAHPSAEPRRLPPRRRLTGWPTLRTSSGPLASNALAASVVRGCSSVGRALHSHCRGRRFDSDQLHHSSTGRLRDARMATQGGSGLACEATRDLGVDTALSSFIRAHPHGCAKPASTSPAAAIFCRNLASALVCGQTHRPHDGVCHRLRSRLPDVSWRAPLRTPKRTPSRGRNLLVRRKRRQRLFGDVLVL